VKYLLTTTIICALNLLGVVVWTISPDPLWMARIFLPLNAFVVGGYFGLYFLKGNR
jgi:hypothetical protein